MNIQAATSVAALLSPLLPEDIFFTDFTSPLENSVPLYLLSLHESKSILSLNASITTSDHICIAEKEIRNVINKIDISIQEK